MAEPSIACLLIGHDDGIELNVQRRVGGVRIIGDDEQASPGKILSIGKILVAEFRT